MRTYGRLLVAVFGIAFAVFVALRFRRPVPPPVSAPIARIDPGAIVESTGGYTQRFTRSREDVLLKFDKQRIYANGSTTLFGVRIITQDRGTQNRSFNVTANEGQAGPNESNLALHGNIVLSASDGMTVRTEDATYSDSDKTVRAPGAVSFARGRISGTGTGMTYDDAKDQLTLLAQSVVHIAKDEKGGGAADITSETAVFARRDKYLRFDKAVNVQRDGQKTEADTAVGHLSADGNHVETVELRGHSRINAAKAAAGTLQSLTGNDMDLRYAADGESIEHAHIDGDAVLQLAGEAGNPGGRIGSKILDISLAPDGSTPTALVGRENVEVRLPPEGNTPGRTMTARNLDAKGEPKRGLTRAVFTVDVRYREQGPDTRDANASSMDVGLKSGFSTIEDARFAHQVRFEQGAMTALSAAARYDPDKGTLELTGSEPGALVPHVHNDQIAVDATKIDVTLEGPKMHATGEPVKSVIQPPKKDAKDTNRMPSMLKQDQPVTVLANMLDYDGTASKSAYSGEARLFQGDTSIKAASIVLDDKSGDLVAAGAVTTTTMLDQTNEKTKKKERLPSIGTAKDFKYEDAIRRLTYTGEAHINGPQGDMTAARIELYLKPSGDELDRAEAYDALTLKEQNRTTTGNRMTYTTADEQYVVTGLPVEIVDECGRKTTGKTLTFTKATDRIVVDGNDQIRTQTRSGTGKCSS